MALSPKIQPQTLNRKAGTLIPHVETVACRSLRCEAIQSAGEWRASEAVRCLVFQGSCASEGCSAVKNRFRPCGLVQLTSCLCVPWFDCFTLREEELRGLGHAGVGFQSFGAFNRETPSILHRCRLSLPEYFKELSGCSSLVSD